MANYTDLLHLARVAAPGRSRRRGATLLSLGALSLLLPAGASAQNPAAERSKPRFQYAAKFSCGVNQGTLADEAGVLPGSYATAVEIHNPHGAAVRLRKKVALSFPVVDGSFVSGAQIPGAVSFFQAESLGPDEALQVDCGQIPADFEFPPSGPVIGPAISFHSGFLVVESEASLDVRVTYTGESLTTGSRTIDVEPVPERRL